jgi:hypothetical protein
MGEKKDGRKEDGRKENEEREISDRKMPVSTQGTERWEKGRWWKMGETPMVPSPPGRGLG